MHLSRILKKAIPLFLLIIILELSLLLKVSSKKEGALNFSDPKVLKIAIEQEIKENGVEETYSKLKKASEIDITASHQAFHIFGEILFEKQGVSGLMHCDNSFGFGCFHGFFLRAISSEGVGIVTQADRACVKRFGEGGLGCQHGIGHGIMEYFAHKDINKALEICSNLSWKGKMFGCQDGVFMEYNFPISLASDGNFNVGTRETSDNFYFPCDEVDLKYRISCYYNLPSWWIVLPHADVKDIGTRCQTIGDSKSRKACFLGVGHKLASQEFDTKKTIRDCLLMPDNDSIAICRAGAAWTFFAQPEKKDNYLDLCRDAENIIEECQVNWNLFGIYKS